MTSNKSTSKLYTRKPKSQNLDLRKQEVKSVYRESACRPPHPAAPTQPYQLQYLHSYPPPLQLTPTPRSQLPVMPFAICHLPSDHHPQSHCRYCFRGCLALFSHSIFYPPTHIVTYLLAPSTLIPSHIVSRAPAATNPPDPSMECRIEN